MNIQLRPEQALKEIAELKSSPLGSAIEADLAMIDPDPLRKKLGNNKDALQRLARLFGKRSGLSLLTRYPLRWFQWVGAGVLVLSLLTASGMGVQEWLAAGNGEARLSVLAEQGGGIGWVGVEESGASLEKRASTEGLLRLPVETRLPLRRKWQLVFYDGSLQPVHTVELGRINENQLVRLNYEKAETPGETGELVVTDKQRNVLADAEVTLRSALFMTTARADRTLVLPVGEYEVQVENSKGIGTAWQKVSVSNDVKKIAEFEPTWFRDSLQNGGFGPAMVPIKGGTFRMGDIQGQGEDNEKPVHEVRIDAFALGRYEVTVGEFRAFVEQSGYQPKENSSCFVDQDRTGRGWKEIQEAGWDNPLFAQSDDQPVVCVSWEDATAYAQWLSEETGQQYRLPTEAEWEYAARSETETVRYWGDDPEDGCGFANVADAAMGLYYPSEKKDWEFQNCLDGWVYTAPAGSLNPNGFFLHDMLGNVWEWTADWHGGYSFGSQINPLGLNQGSSALIVRGGSWYHSPADVRSADRNGLLSFYRNGFTGFRLARTNPQPSIPFTLAPAKVEQAEKLDPLPPLVEPEMVLLKGGSFQMVDIQEGGDDDGRLFDEAILIPVARINPQPSIPFTLAPAKVEQQEKTDPPPPLAKPEMIPLKGGSFQMGDTSHSIWKPPIPSAAEFISQQFLNSHKLVTLEDVGKALEKALRRDGFNYTAYLLVPEGFALVSNVDEARLSLDGTPISPSATKGRNALGFLVRMLFLPKQQPYYTVVSVIVTSGRAYYEDEPKIKFKKAKNLVVSGKGTTFPKNLKNKEYIEKKYICIAMLYVFEEDPSGDEIGPSGNKLRFISLTDPNNKINIREHLQKTGFWDNP